MELFAQIVETSYEFSTSSNMSAVSASFLLMWILILWLIMAIALWKVFTKAGEKGWASLIPIYNVFVLVRIAGREWVWFLLLFIPFVNFVIYIILSMDIAKAFGKSAAFGIIGLWLFSFFGFMILGWGDATYTKPVHE